MATQITVPNLTLSQDARLYKYVRLPSGWKYLRADYSEGFGVKPHAVFLPKTNISNRKTDFAVAVHRSVRRSHVFSPIRLRPSPIIPSRMKSM